MHLILANKRGEKNKAWTETGINDVVSYCCKWMRSIQHESRTGDVWMSECFISSSATVTEVYGSQQSGKPSLQVKESINSFGTYARYSNSFEDALLSYIQVKYWEMDSRIDDTMYGFLATWATSQLQFQDGLVKHNTLSNYSHCPIYFYDLIIYFWFIIFWS